jgi:AraC-like DNA-binding protein
VAHLVRHGRGRFPDCGGEADRALRRVRDTMHGEMAEPLTVARLAAAAELGRFRLIRAFRRRFGLPPSVYLRTLRLEAAKRLLAEGDAPAAVAATVGFADQSHLNRLFKRAYGLTPGAYRAALAA